MQQRRSVAPRQTYYRGSRSNADGLEAGRRTLVLFCWLQEEVEEMGQLTGSEDQAYFSSAVERLETALTRSGAPSAPDMSQASEGEAGPSGCRTPRTHNIIMTWPPSSRLEYAGIGCFVSTKKNPPTASPSSCQHKEGQGPTSQI